MRCADCGVGMGAGEKADDEFVSHSGVTGRRWREAWEDGLTGRLARLTSPMGGIGIGLLLLLIACRTGHAGIDGMRALQ